MKKIIIFILLALITNLCLAQGGESQPSQNFGNSLQGAGGIDTGSINAVLAFKGLQEKADEHYKAERYEQAFTHYLRLAEYNDKFSQYRIGSMYAAGRGVPKNSVLAYAWTYVAAETRQKGLVNYHIKIRESLTPAELDRGRERANEYLQDYGTFAMANKARKLIRREKRSCTGSRVGSSCDKVASASGNCGSSSQGVLSSSCMTLGAVGLPAVSGLQPSDLRTAERQLDQMIDQYNPGRVELGELEIIED